MELQPRSEIDVYRELLRLGYKLAPTTRTEVYEHKVGTQTITYAHRLLVSGGPGPLKGALREAVKTHQPRLLAAACVLHPPVHWMLVLVDHYLMAEVAGEVIQIGGRPCRVGLSTVAANVASFIGQNPLSGSPRLEAIIDEALG
jgi:hypothetical protein